MCDNRWTQSPSCRSAMTYRGTESWRPPRAAHGPSRQAPTGRPLDAPSQHTIILNFLANEGADHACNCRTNVVIFASLAPSCWHLSSAAAQGPMEAQAFVGEPFGVAPLR